MEFTGTTKDIGTNYDRSVKFGSAGTKQSGENGDNIRFGDVLRDAAAENTDGNNTNVPFHSSFSAGAAVERLGAMSQIKDALFDEEFGSGETEDLDADISFDEIQNLDVMTDIAAAEKPQEDDAEEDGLFLDSSIFSEDFIPAEEMLAFGTFEDVI